MMKNYTKSLLLMVFAIVAFAFTTRAQVTITQWTFLGDVTTPSTGSGTASLIGGTTETFASGVTGAPDRAWNTSTYPEQGLGSGTAGVEFLVATTSYSNIAVSWDGRHSNTSANRIRLQYTLNGTAWVNFEASASNATNTSLDVDKGFDNGRYIADAGDAWYQRSASFGSIAGATNNPSFGVRIVSEFVDGAEYGAATSGSTYSPMGTLRYDNVTFQGGGSSPLITGNPGSLSGFTYIEGSGPSAIQTTLLNGFNLTPAGGNISLTAPADFEISGNGTDFLNAYEFAYTSGGFSDVSISIRLKAGLSAGSYSGAIAISGGGAPAASVNVSGSVTMTTPPAISSIILPKYMEGVVPNNSRVPFAYRAAFTNLLPSATYRYYNKIVLSTDEPDYNGAGNCIFVNPVSGTFTRTSSTSFTTPGEYGEFTTDAAGSFSGWFMTEPTGNATRFKPGTELLVRIILNDGAGGTIEALRLTSTETVKVLGFYTTSADSTGTAIRGISNSAAKNFIFLYDNTDGTGRPLYGTQVETSGVDFAAATSYAAFYTENVAGNNGAWGGIVPNINANGVKRVEERNILNGNVVTNNTSADGVWGTTDTKNPAGGTETVLVINTALGVDTPDSGIAKVYTYGNILKIEMKQVVNGIVRVIDLNGKQVAVYNLNGNDASFTTNLPNGIYFVQIISDKGTFSNKVFIR